MELKTAKAQAEERLKRFVGLDEITTETLNEIENEVNDLIVGWARDHRYFVQDGRGNLVKGIKLWYDLFSGSLRFAFRYLGQKVGRQ